MARGTQFLQLVQMLRDETRRSTNVAVGVEDVAELKRILNRNYEQLLLNNDWPHLLKFFPAIMMNAGQRYYDMPDGLSFESILDVAFYYSQQPMKIERGIGFAEYAYSNPDLGTRSDPVLKWDIRIGDNVQEMVEVWPLPASTGQYGLQFYGSINTPRMVNDEDQCFLDDNLVVAFAAAEILTGDKSPLAQVKSAYAQQRLATLKAKNAVLSPTVRLGLGQRDPAFSSRAVIRIASK